MAYSLLSLQLQKMFFISLSIIFLVVSVSTSHAFTNSSSKREGLVLNLIHRDLIVKPTYPSNSTLLDEIELELSRDAGSSHQDYNPDVASMRSNGHNFFVEVYLGSKMVRQYLAFSTVIPFIWVQCTEDSTSGVFHPHASNSYKPSTCLPAGGGRYCSKVPGGRCDGKNRCQFTMQGREGFVGFDTVTFHTAHHGPSYVPGVLIGCGEDKVPLPLAPQENGVFGLGGIGELSILDTLIKKFSFCFGSLSEPNYQYNQLALGLDAQLRGVPVPFTLHRGFVYQVDSFGIDFGRERITTNQLKFKIDTMTKFSSISSDIEKQIRGKVEREVGKKMTKIKLKDYPDALCYTAPALINPIPELVIHLYHYALRLDANSLFLKVNNRNAYCLSIRPSSDPSDNSIAASALQHHNVGFDWTTKRAYFERTDCSRIHQLIN